MDRMDVQSPSEPSPPAPPDIPPPPHPSDNPPQRPGRAASQQAKTLIACVKCREKKVKCSGEQPCDYCSRRRIECVYMGEKRKHIWSLQESEQNPRPSAPRRSEGGGTRSSLPSEPPRRRSYVLHGGVPSYTDPASYSVSPRTPFDRPSSQAGDDKPASGWTAVRPAPVSSSSSNGYLGPKPPPALPRSPRLGSPIITTDFPPAPENPSRPSEEEAHAILETVVLNVGILQQFFDIRAFSDNLSIFYHNPEAVAQLPPLWSTELFLVLAIGRMLQTKTDQNPEVPETDFIHESMNQLPNLSKLRSYGILGVEVLGLIALYLQIADLKGDAYIYSSTALRLAVSLGMHKVNGTKDLRRSEAVHRNRLWWTIYMQERRLASASGLPMAISDHSIQAKPPSDIPGFPSAAAIAVNVRVARITGRISSTIYAQQTSDSTTSSMMDIRSVLYSLQDVELNMPAEYSLEFGQSGLLIAGRPIKDTAPQISRTGCSLYLSLYQTVVHAVLPVLVNLASTSRDQDREVSSEPSQNPKHLVGLCVRAAGRNLKILQELCNLSLIEKHGYLDQDTLFSVAFVHLLMEVAKPKQSIGINGFAEARSLLHYLASIGNQGAVNRLAEADQIAHHLSLFSQSRDRKMEQASSQQLQLEGPIDHYISDIYHEDMATLNGTDRKPRQLFSNVDLGNLSFESNGEIYRAYHNSEPLFTSVDKIDRAALEQKIFPV